MLTPKYLSYIAGPRWKKRKERYYSKFRKACALCGKGNPEVRIQLHHLTYERLGYERDEDLMPLCELHHAGVKKGYFPFSRMRWKVKGKWVTAWTKPQGIR